MDIGVDVPPDLLRTFTTISVLVSDFTLSRDIRSRAFSILRDVLNLVKITLVTAREAIRQSSHRSGNQSGRKASLKHGCTAARTHGNIFKSPELAPRTRSVELLLTVCTFM